MEESLLDLEVKNHPDVAAVALKQPSWGLPHVCVLIFALSFVLFAVCPEGQFSELNVSYGGEAVHVAQSLASRGSFADPFALLRTGPTAHVAPMYPFLYSLFLRAFGSGYATHLIVWAWNVGLLALQMALLPWLSVRLGLGALPGAIAAALGAVSLHTAIDAHWECFLAGSLLLMIWLMTDSSPFWRRRSGVALLGLLWGILVLTNPVTVLLLIAWFAAKLLTQPAGNRAALGRRFALTAFVALLTVSPWIVRNYARFGTFIFVRDNFGLELFTGNNPCAKPTLAENIDSGCHAQTHPNPTAAIAAQLAAVGEVSFNRAKLQQALFWIDRNRSDFLALTVQRIRQFWLPDLDSRWEQVPVWGVTALALIGLFLLRKENRFAAWLVGITWLVFPVIYYVVPSEPRYRYPIYWTLLLCAGCALSKVCGKLLRPVSRAAGSSGSGSDEYQN